MRFFRYILLDDSNNKEQDRSTSITHLEDLSNEILYEILDYIGSLTCDRIFPSLNQRFSSLVYDSRLTMTFDLRYETKDEIEYLLQHFSSRQD